MRLPLFLLLALLFLARPAYADEADELYADARAAGDRGDAVEAYRLYRRAWLAREDYRTAANLAALEIELERWPDAMEHLTYALNHVPSDVSAAKRQELKDALTRVAQRVVTLHLRIKPATASVLVDDKVQSRTTTTPMFLEPGRHELKLKQAGYETLLVSFTGQPGQVHAVERTLTPLAEGTEAALAPSAPPQEPATATRKDEHPSRSSVPSGVWIAGGISLTALGTGLSFSLAAASANEDADALAQKLTTEAGDPNVCRRPSMASGCTRLQSLLDKSDQRSGIAAVSYVVAAASAATGFGIWLLTDEQKTDAPRVALAPSLDGGTLIVSGKF